MHLAQALVVHAVSQPNLIERPIETRQMRVEIHEPSINYRRDFIDRVAEQKGAIEDGDLRLFFRHVGAVDIDNAGHGMRDVVAVRSLGGVALGQTQDSLVQALQAFTRRPASAIRARSSSTSLFSVVSSLSP